MNDSERTIEARLRQAVENAGGLCKKISFIGERGCPDRLVVLRGALTLVELKQRRGVLSEQQKRFREDCRRLGVPVAVVRSIAEAEALVERMAGPPDA